MSWTHSKELGPVLAFLCACGVTGCSSDGAVPAAGAGGSTGGGGAAASSCDGIDYASFMGGTVPSFKTDIMPIFGLSCTASDCHNSHDHKAGLDLGWKCNPVAATATTPFRCEFPAAVDPNTMSQNPPKPLTQDVLTAVHASLMAPAKTITAGNVARVIPGNAEHSFLLEKVANTQAKQGYACVNQDPSHTQNPLPCGDSMPLNADALCTDGERFGLLARWIANGAPPDN